MENKVFQAIKNKSEGVHITELANTLKADRHTVAKYLEILSSKGLIELKRIGMAKVWIVAENPVVNLLKQDDPLGQSLRQIFSQIPGQIHIVNQDMKIQWTDHQRFEHVVGHSCHKIQNKEELCDGCPATKSFEDGQKHSIRQTVGKKTLEFTTIPFKTANNEYSVLEIVKEIK